MGAWGPESCSSDACWDLMGSIADIHDPKQSEVAPCLNAVLREEEDDTYYPRARFGVVIWLLDHGMKIPMKYLKWAEAEGERLLDAYNEGSDEDYPEEYIPVIERELDIVRKAIKNDGQGEKRHVKGLMERIGEKLTEGRPGPVNVTG